MSNAEASSSTAHEMRITNHGKIANWVTFALDYLQKYEDRPLVLHTLPATKGKALPAVADMAADPTPAPAPATESAQAKKIRGSGLHPSMATIPRLVSVVEIIKREYLKTLDPALAKAGCLSGLHQYNEIDDLESAGYIEETGDEEQDRLATLVLAMQGRNHVKQRKTAFMRVTLCRRKMPELIARGATYQPPAVRRLSKSARARLKHKLRKANATHEQLT
ncbi:hypothetical protein C8Q79DRAFT_904582 [Trametes meyenii]|nr:hypothetical protein C8Q79DRAFT_904582 [Trametes meyenii]